MMLSKSLLAAIGLALLIPWAYAKQPVFETRAGAIRGYDTVAYFTHNKPVKGNDRYSLDWKGATWYFASADNRNRFKADPARRASIRRLLRLVANGYTASTDPGAWRIVNGRLYLNYSLRVQEKWSQHIPGNIARGDKNWPKVLE